MPSFSFCGLSTVHSSMPSLKSVSAMAISAGEVCLEDGREAGVAVGALGSGAGQLQIQGGRACCEVGVRAWAMTKVTGCARQSPPNIDPGTSA